MLLQPERKLRHVGVCADRSALEQLNVIVRLKLGHMMLLKVQLTTSRASCFGAPREHGSHSPASAPRHAVQRRFPHFRPLPPEDMHEDDSSSTDPASDPSTDASKLTFSLLFILVPCMAPLAALNFGRTHRIFHAGIELEFRTNFVLKDTN